METRRTRRGYRMHKEGPVLRGRWPVRNRAQRLKAGAYHGRRPVAQETMKQGGDVTRSVCVKPLWQRYRVH